jgi:A/G-specific adenine glycosylase
MKIDPGDIQYFQEAVISWGKKNLRTYCWRANHLDPFSLLVTEVLLVRTRADAVERVVLRVLDKFPNAESLSCANIESIEMLLYPLGLFRKRAKALVQVAKALVYKHGGLVPQRIDELLALPYVGRYVANAVLCFAFNEKHAIVDANIARLLERYFHLDPNVGKLDENEEYWDLASKLLPKRNVKTYNWALLDLGGLICQKHRPLCLECPLSEDCFTYKMDKRAAHFQKGSSRHEKWGSCGGNREMSPL